MNEDATIKSLFIAVIITSFLNTASFASISISPIAAGVLSSSCFLVSSFTSSSSTTSCTQQQCPTNPRHRHRHYEKGGFQHRHFKTQLQMGMEIKIRIVGRKNGAEQWLEDAYVQYEQRLRSSNLDVSTIWHKHNEDITKNVEKDSEKGHSVVLLDPSGGLKTSEELSTSVYSWLDKGGSRLTFVIGGAEGLPSELKYHATTNRFPKLSLSPLTFTHQMTRTILMEQIYRASEIQKGTGYHK